MFCLVEPHLQKIRGSGTLRKLGPFVPAWILSFFWLMAGHKEVIFDSKSLSRKVSKTCVSVDASPAITAGLLFALGEAFASRKK